MIPSSNVLRVCILGSTFAALLPLSDPKGVAQARPDPPFRVPRGQLTFDAEGLERPGHPGHSRQLHWPGGASGPTIGRGYDLKERTSEQVIEDLKAAGVDPEVARQYAAGAGKGPNGNQAETFVKENRDQIPEITAAQQQKLFERVYARYEAEVRAICERDDVVAAYGRVDWDKLRPAIRDILVDLNYRGDYTRRARELVQKLTVANDLPGLTRMMADRDAWPKVPCDRFYRRIHSLRRAGGLEAAASPALDTGPAGSVRIVYDESVPKGGGYRTPVGERLGKTAAQIAREPAYSPQEGQPQPAAFARDLGRRLAGRDVPELQGTVAEQFDLLKTSPFVEKLWLPERLPSADRQRLVDVRTLLAQDRTVRAELADARKRGDRASIDRLAAESTRLWREVQGKTLCLRLALGEAQDRADQGDLVLAVWKDPTGADPGRIAWIVPTRGSNARLLPSEDWAGIGLPHAAQAATTVTGDGPLDVGFKAVETVEGLSLFAFRPAPKPRE
jgi:hypothetical protein